MKISHVVYNLNKIILNKNNFVMASYSHNGTAFIFFEFVSTLARYTGFHRHIKTSHYVNTYLLPFRIYRVNVVLIVDRNPVLLPITFRELFT